MICLVGRVGVFVWRVPSALELLVILEPLSKLFTTTESDEVPIVSAEFNVLNFLPTLKLAFLSASQGALHGWEACERRRPRSHTG